MPGGGPVAVPHPIILRSPGDPPRCTPCFGLIRKPAYSPELNPVERLWEDLKARIDVMDARVRASLSALQEHVASIVQRYTAATIASLTGYAYLVEAVYDL